MFGVQDFLGTTLICIWNVPFSERGGGGGRSGVRKLTYVNTFISPFEPLLVSVKTSIVHLGMLSQQITVYTIGKKEKVTTCYDNDNLFQYSYKN